MEPYYIEHIATDLEMLMNRYHREIESDIRWAELCMSNVLEENKYEINPAIFVKGIYMGDVLDLFLLDHIFHIKKEYGQFKVTYTPAESCSTYSKTVEDSMPKKDNGLPESIPYYGVDKSVYTPNYIYTKDGDDKYHLEAHVTKFICPRDKSDGNESVINNKDLQLTSQEKFLTCLRILFNGRCAFIPCIASLADACGLKYSIHCIDIDSSHYQITVDDLLLVDINDKKINTFKKIDF